MPTLTGVKFSPYGKLSYCDSNGVDVRVGDRVIVDTDDGPKEGIISIAPDQVIHSDLRGPMFPVLRKLPPPQSSPLGGGRI